jgi:hypothetical protein
MAKVEARVAGTQNYRVVNGSDAALHVKLIGTDGNPYTASGGGGSGGDASAANQVITNTEIGGVTETAPATDTASSGVNGRLQRIAQRLTSLIALLPASLGIKTAAASLSVAPASDAVFTTAPVGVAPTDRSGTITSGGTQQTLMASNASRKGYLLQNNSTGDLWINSTAAAVVGQPSIKLGPGDYYESPYSGTPVGAVSIIGATTGQAFSSREW